MRALLACVAVLLIFAPGASAATVQAFEDTQENVDNSPFPFFTVLQINDDTGEANDITTSAEPASGPKQAMIVTAAAGALTAGPGCKQTGAKSVRCPVNTDAQHQGLVLIDALLGSGDDRFNDVSDAGSVSAGDGNDVLTLAHAEGFGEFGNDVITAARADGGADDDLVTGPEADGGDGNDRLQAVAGGSVLRAGLGNDTLVGGPGPDTLFPGPGADTADGAGGIDTVSYQGDLGPIGVDFDATAPGERTDRLIGVENAIGSNSAQAERLTGNDAANVLLGGGGARDIIAGGGGDDILGQALEVSCGAGTDTVAVAAKGPRTRIPDRGCELFAPLASASSPIGAAATLPRLKRRALQVGQAAFCAPGACVTQFDVSGVGKVTFRGKAATGAGPAAAANIALPAARVAKLAGTVVQVTVSYGPPGGQRESVRYQIKLRR